MAALSAIQTILQSDTLPTLPAVAAKVLSVTDVESYEISEIADIISRDASLSARILKVVNSPFYGLMIPVGTIRKAVSILGFNPVRSLVLSFSLLNMRRAGESFDYERFWEHSLATAVISQRLIRKVGGEEDEAFTAGLMANMGTLLMAGACPELYEKVLETCARADRSQLSAEEEVLGTNHCQIGAEIARRWRLPENLLAVITHHHAPERMSDAGKSTEDLVKAVHLAETLADLFHSSAPEQQKAQFILRSRELLGLEEEAFHELSADAHEEVNRAADYFGLKGGPRKSMEEILQEANLKIGQINLACEQTKQGLIKTQVELIQLARTLQGGRTNLHGMDEIDAATGVYNHRYLQDFVCAELVRPSRSGNLLTVVLLHVDDFSPFLTFGHRGGDDILRQLCQIFRQQVRAGDLIARYSMEDFALALPETDLQEGVRVTQRIQEAVARYEFECQGRISRLSVSAGIACQHPGEIAQGELVQRAERALAAAREQGNSRIVSAESPALP